MKRLLSTMLHVDQRIKRIRCFFRIWYLIIIPKKKLDSLCSLIFSSSKMYNIFEHISIESLLSTLSCESLWLIGQAPLSISVSNHLDELDHPNLVCCGYFQRWSQLIRHILHILFGDVHQSVCGIIWPFAIKFEQSFWSMPGHHRYSDRQIENGRKFRTVGPCLKLLIPIDHWVDSRSSTSVIIN